MILLNWVSLLVKADKEKSGSQGGVGEGGDDPRALKHSFCKMEVLYVLVTQEYS